MERTSLAAQDVDAAIEAVIAHMSPTTVRRHRWTEMREDRLWNSLVGCILGSAVRAEHAAAATHALAVSGLLRHLRLDWGSPLLDKVKAILTNPILDPTTGRTFRYRFPESRSVQIVASAATFYGPGGRGVASALDSLGEGRIARTWLSGNVPGIGPKQASLFLRLTGYEPDLAVLDVHIIRYLRLHGSAIHRPPGTLRSYEAIEELFRRRVQHFGVSLGVADHATWIVMRSLGAAHK